MKQKEYILILGSVLIIVIAWGIFTVYHNLSTTTTDPNENISVEPIAGTFDKNTINQAKNRKRVDVSLNSSTTFVASPTPTLKPSPTPIASASPVLTPTSTPTPTP